MIDLQQCFNRVVFKPESYQFICDEMTAQLGQRAVRLCETPVFLDKDFQDRMIKAGLDIVAQALQPNVVAAQRKFIPAGDLVPGDEGQPTMICVDFAVARGKSGALEPQLIELQGVSSVYALQQVMSSVYSQGYGLGGIASYLPSHGRDDAYIADLKKLVLNGKKAENVVLLEIDPWQQKTVIDFRAVGKILGIPVVGVDEVIKRDDRLYYKKGVNDVRIERIYNRVLMDELAGYAGRDKMSFRFTDRLDVEWVNHPNWAYLLSKSSMPFLTHATVPESRFLDDARDLPQNLEDYVLKPLFSFGGAGVKVDVTPADVAAVPADVRHAWMLQRKVDYAPFLEAPDGTKSKAELRVMYLRVDGQLKPAILFARISRAKMMNVLFNKTDKWVGVAPVFSVDRGKLPSGAARLCRG